ncbi:Cysteine-rich protein 2-binding protein [Portunus trituberculatus]|uniref:Cysteine-rich protein 2-binding protein n=2 Tax=Portunus trituberculatus TaxID=210409 RepID=A0A5B7E8R6_PORTR|nr:Cysteine-rich protein 2-binding protein [Portunus trituberculatus]
MSPPSAPIDFCYVTAKHIPAMNQLARHFFWPGIDLSEVLQYPDHTCVVLYRRLVVGFGVVVPDTGYNEAYLSFLLVHPEWRRAGIATFLLYHLIQTCPGKDVTLHVSATNPALILYQQFGFKVEEFLSNFYDKYLPHDSPVCKHAMFMRLGR